MRRIALSLALLLASTGPAAAIDLGRLLPMPDLPLPSWNGGDKPAPPPAATPRADAEAPRPGGEVTQDAAAAAAGSTAPASSAALRPRGWRSLLPGSIK